MLERDDGLEKPPARSTIGEILKRNGLAAGRGRRRPRHVHGPPSELTAPGRPNHVRAADCKGWFLLGDGRRCIPLTITDLHSRFVILLSADEVSTQAAARRGFERAFREFGLPEAIRVDNGAPFATMGPGNPGKLGVWWPPHGIRVEFIRRGKPQDNDSHERMRRTLKAECCEAAKADRRAQQRRFDQWREEFNGSRPHEALGMRTPSEACRRSGVAYDGRALRAGRRAAARRRVGGDQPGRARPACGGGAARGAGDPGAAGERSRRGAEDALAQQLRQGVLDELRMAVVGEAGGKLLDHAGAEIDLAQQEHSAVGATLPPLKSATTLRPPRS